MDIIYIYKYTNKINGHAYIGKTNNVERRKREHKSNAYNPSNSFYYSLCLSYSNHIVIPFNFKNTVNLLDLFSGKIQEFWLFLKTIL